MMRKDDALRERMALALHGIEDYPHRLRGSEYAVIGTMDCMTAHRSKAYSILVYMDVLESKPSPTSVQDTSHK